MYSPRLLKAALGGLAFVSGALAEPVPTKAQPVHPRQQTITPGGKPCGEHGPDNRGCWMNNWTIDKENEIDPPPAFVSDWPSTGPLDRGIPSNRDPQNNREYDLYITNETN